MASNRGYIYVLANSAMPDLVKVGKTTRTPAERAAELSKVTGVPTPFIVVYEQLVDDCTAAEEFVHTMLQQKGYRESDNREFFRAPVSEIVGIIAKMPTQFSSNSDFEDDEDAEFFSSESDEELDEFVLDDDEDDEPDYPWLALWENAEKYHDGSDDCFQDYYEAIKLYKQAIKLGCPLAYKKIGDMYLNGEGVTENHKKALEWYKEGIKNGNYECYAGMANIFYCNEQIEDFHKAYKLLFRDRKNKRNAIVEDFLCIYNCNFYITTCFIKKLEPRIEVALDGIFGTTTKRNILHEFKKNLDMREKGKSEVDKRAVIAFRLSIDWAEENL
jgi:tetratricopeptide (TPR) repeat protein